LPAPQNPELALGDYEKAAEYAQKAAAQAPDVAKRKNLEAMAQTLAEGSLSTTSRLSAVQSDRIRGHA
jgi:hypothetical protein